MERTELEEKFWSICEMIDEESILTELLSVVSDEDLEEVLNTLQEYYV